LIVAFPNRQLVLIYNRFSSILQNSISKFVEFVTFKTSQKQLLSLMVFLFIASIFSKNDELFFVGGFLGFGNFSYGF